MGEGRGRRPWPLPPLILSPSLARWSLGGILQQDIQVGQLLANGVGPGPILIFAGLHPLIDEAFDLFRGDFQVRRLLAQGLDHRLGIGLEQVQHLPQAHQDCHRSPGGW